MASGGGPTSDGGRSGWGRRSVRWRRALLLTVLGAAALLVSSILLSLVPALGSVRHLQDGRAALSRAQEGLLRADLTSAQADFTQARTAFEQASSNANNLLTEIPSSIPVLGRTFDALRTLADVGGQLSAVGEETLRSVQSLPGGASALGPRDGRLPLDVYTQLLPVVSRAHSALETAEGQVDAIATSMVPSQIVDARTSAQHHLADALPTVRSVEALLRWIPAFAGRDGLRTYLVAAQNPAELRGTGGEVTMYSILTLDHGKMHIAPFRDTPSLGHIDPADGVWPSPSVEAAFGSFDSATALHNTNITPDVPTASKLLLGLWDRTQHTHLDGVVFVNTIAMRYVMQPLGSVDVPGVPTTLTSDNVVRFVTSRAYALYPNRDARKRLLGRVGTKVFTGFFRDAHGLPALRAMADAAAAGMLTVYTVDPQVERAFQVAGLGGDLEATGDPMFGAFVNNIGGDKLDAFLHPSLTYDVRLRPDGSGLAEATLVLHNDAPRNPPPVGEVFGPNDKGALQGMGLVAGETYLQTFFYCGQGCTLSAATIDGQPLPIHRYEQNGLQLYSTSLRILPQASRTIRLSLSIAHAWQEGPDGRTASILIPAQAMLNPLTATVRVQTPDQQRIRWADPSGTVAGDRATWTLEPAPSTDFRIGF